MKPTKQSNNQSTKNYFDFTEKIVFRLFKIPAIIQNTRLDQRSIFKILVAKKWKSFEIYRVRDVVGEARFNNKNKMDYTWVCHYDPETKRQSMDWKHIDSRVSNKLRDQSSVKNFMLIISWDIKRPITIDFLEKGKRVKSAFLLAIP